jgi:hypothetical protein
MITISLCFYHKSMLGIVRKMLYKQKVIVASISYFFFPHLPLVWFIPFFSKKWMMAKHILVLLTIHFVSYCAHFGPTIDMWQDIHPCHQIFPWCDEVYFFSILFMWPKIFWKYSFRFTCSWSLTCHSCSYVHKLTLLPTN